MKFTLRRACGLGLLLGCLAASGCLPSGQAQLDEEKEPHFLQGKGRANTMDYDGAIQSFENALIANPKSSSAHFELGLLYDQRKGEPATAIYHYSRFLEAHSTGEKPERARTRIYACKQELARTVSLAPVTQNLQHEFDQLTEDNRRCREENERWRAYFLRLQGQTNPPPVSSAERGPSLPPVTGGSRAVQGSPFRNPESEVPQSSFLRTSLSSGGPKTHTVKGGETPSAIARKYNIRLETLMAANPRLDARRMQVGQMLSIPVQ